MTNHIAIAVEPLRAEAVERAHQHALATVENIRKRLSEANWDAKIVAPYPDGGMHDSIYQSMLSLYTTVRKLTKKNGTYTLYRDTPEIVKMDSKLISNFVKEAEDNADAQYTAFVNKLNEKVGNCVSAALEGNHVWGYSFLTIVKADGSTEIWKTQMIVNVSKLGKIFNQFPTRKSKSKN